ncbi:MAG: hypothetical protein M1838_000164 [Thelocarpon superellum]|nr:MAG: hypothetical protein M1838_000164 [Thelocarpon superellum]
MYEFLPHASDQSEYQIITASAPSPMSKRNLQPAPDPTQPVVQARSDPLAPGMTFAEPSLAGQAPYGTIAPPPQTTSPSVRKRKAPGPQAGSATAPSGAEAADEGGEGVSSSPATKKSRTNTPWSPAEEQRLKTMRDAGNSWSEIAKTFPNRTEGSVKKHWYKDMHYAEFAEDESAALLAAIKEYETSKWKVIGQKVGKPAKVSRNSSRAMSAWY